MGGATNKILHPVKSFRKWKVKVLYHKLMNEDIDKLPNIARKLSRIDHPLTLLACVNLLTHEYPEVRAWAVDQVGCKKKYMENSNLKKEVYIKLDELLSSKEHYLREAAVAAIGALGDNKITAGCIRTLLRSENDASVIIKCIDILSECRDTDPNRVLRWMLKKEKFERYWEDVRMALRETY